MPVVNRQQYEKMLKNAKENNYAYPSINVTSMETVNSVLAALVEKKSDGIIQISTGGAQFSSGLALSNMRLGAQAIAEYVHFMAPHYDINVALHTDHCVYEKIDSFITPLVEATKKRREKGLGNLFTAHMFDGSTIDLNKNLDVSRKLLDTFNDLDLVLEIEIGAVGGEEDGIKSDINEKLYTSNEDMLKVAEVMGLGENGCYLLAATFGNVHGSYRPGKVKLKPEILRDGQKFVGEKFKKDQPFYFVFHGGSGSEPEKIRDSLLYGVVKMNVDTDTQYAFSRPIVDHVMKNYDSLLKIDGDVGNKSYYDPRSYLKKAQKSMQQRVMQACDDLNSSHKTLYKKNY